MAKWAKKIWNSLKKINFQRKIDKSFKIWTKNEKNGKDKSISINYEIDNLEQIYEDWDIEKEATIFSIYDGMNDSEKEYFLKLNEIRYEWGLPLIKKIDEI